MPAWEVVTARIDSGPAAAIAAVETHITDRELKERGLPVEEALQLFEARKGVLEVRERVERFATLSDAGKQMVDSGIAPVKEVNLLTPEMLKDGSWRDVEFRPYDVTAAAEAAQPWSRVMASMATVTASSSGTFWSP